MHTVSLFTPTEMAQHRKIELPLIIKGDLARLIPFWRGKKLDMLAIITANRERDGVE